MNKPKTCPACKSILVGRGYVVQIQAGKQARLCQLCSLAAQRGGNALKKRIVKEREVNIQQHARQEKLQNFPGYEAILKVVKAHFEVEREKQPGAVPVHFEKQIEAMQDDIQKAEEAFIKIKKAIENSLEKIWVEIL